MAKTTAKGVTGEGAPPEPPKGVMVMGEGDPVVPVKYVSKYHNHEIVISHTYLKVTGSIAELIKGKKIVFDDQGEYETADEDIKEFLDAHPSLGVDFIKVVEEEPQAM